MSERRKGMENGACETDEYMRRPVIKTRWRAFADAIYNPSKKKFLGKTGRQWGITGVFYLCFFAGLAIFCAICMEGLLATLPEHEPRWQLDRSLIGTNPGLGFRPLPENVEQGSIIGYKASNTTQVTIWIDRLNKFLSNYIHSSKSPTTGRSRQRCSYDHAIIRPGNVCDVEVDTFGPCAPEKGYGFKESSPCVFIKLNRIYGWIPEYYNNSKDLPPDMPQDLVDHISKIPSKQLNTIWVSCNGTHSTDRELIGPVDYYPAGIQGFPGYYYPYSNIHGYLSPLVAVHFVRPQRNQIISVECRAWAKNIQYDQREKLGVVSFQLQID